jgi:hypothetical protein
MHNSSANTHPQSCQQRPTALDTLPMGCCQRLCVCMHAVIALQDKPRRCMSTQPACTNHRYLCFLSDTPAGTPLSWHQQAQGHTAALDNAYYPHDKSYRPCWEGVSMCPFPLKTSPSYPTRWHHRSHAQPLSPPPRLPPFRPASLPASLHPPIHPISPSRHLINLLLLLCTEGLISRPHPHECHAQPRPLPPSLPPPNPLTIQASLPASPAPVH